MRDRQTDRDRESAESESVLANVSVLSCKQLVEISPNLQVSCIGGGGLRTLYLTKQLVRILPLVQLGRKTK